MLPRLSPGRVSQEATEPGYLVGYYSELLISLCLLIFVFFSVKVIGYEGRLQSGLNCVRWGVKTFVTYSGSVFQADGSLTKFRSPNWADILVCMQFCTNSIWTVQLYNRICAVKMLILCRHKLDFQLQ